MLLEVHDWSAQRTGGQAHTGVTTTVSWGIFCFQRHTL